MPTKNILMISLLISAFSIAGCSFHTPNSESCANIRYEIQQYNNDPKQIRVAPVTRNYQVLQRQYDSYGCKSLVDFGQIKTKGITNHPVQ